MGQWTFLSILGRHNKRITIFTTYKPCKRSIEIVEHSTVIKHQWLVIKSKQYNQHPHQAAINDVIIAIKKLQKERHEIIISLDGNKAFQ